MKPVVIVESETRDLYRNQSLLSDVVYTDIYPFYLKYMQLYRLEYGNVDQAMGLPELTRKIDKGHFGDVITLCEITSRDTMLCCKIMEIVGSTGRT